MKDFRGVELAVGDTVAWTVGRSEMHRGVIDSFTDKKARVVSIRKDGTAHSIAGPGDPPIYIVDTLRIAKITP